MKGAIVFLMTLAAFAAVRAGICPPGVNPGTGNCRPPECKRRISLCRVTSWSFWTACSHNCGSSGVRRRSRKVIYKKDDCGEPCIRPQNIRLSESNPCNRDKCQNGATPHSNGCSCRSGFTGQCCGSDVNECAGKPCAHYCTNTHGSYSCTCKTCYTKSGNNCNLNKCIINGRCYNFGNVNPSNPCQQCYSANKFRWTNNNNLKCNDGLINTKNDRCSNGRCVGTPYSCLNHCEDYTGSGCRHVKGCIISFRNVRRCFKEGTLNPDNECYKCSGRTTTWTPNFGHQCDDKNICTANDKCNNKGACAGQKLNCGKICLECGGKKCNVKNGFGYNPVDGKCRCKIGGQLWLENQFNPSNPCQICKFTKPDRWSNADGAKCNDNNPCSFDDRCKKGVCLGISYTCSVSGSCVAQSKCRGRAKDDCEEVMKPKNSICRPAYDVCDTAESCDGKHGACPAERKDAIVVATGSVKITEHQFNKEITYQYITDKLSIEIAPFKSPNCGQQKYKWYLLENSATCNADSSTNGYLPISVTRKTLTGLKLENTKSYKISVEKHIDTTRRKKVSRRSCSNAVIIDNSVPKGGWVRDGPGPIKDLNYQRSKIVHAHWGGFKMLHGAGKYEWKVNYYSLGSKQKVEALGFTNVGLSTNARRMFPNLSDGTNVTVTVRGYTKAGRFSQVTSDGSVIDTSPPTPGKVYDGAKRGKDVKYAKWKSSFSANWERFIDQHSSIAYYKWAVLLVGQLSPGPFKNTGLSTLGTATGLHLITRKRYCAVVRGYNHAGLFTQVMSDCVLIDHESPHGGLVNDGSSVGTDVDFQSEDTTLFANWNGFKDNVNGSGIAEYQYTINEKNGKTIVKWTSVGIKTHMSHPGLFLKDGATYIIKVRAIDAVGYTVDVASDGITIDASHPVFTGRIIVEGESGTYKGKPCVYVSNRNALTAKYSGFSDQHSGLDYYEWALKPLDQIAQKPKFLRTPGARLGTSSSISGLNLEDGKPYRLTIRAFNHAGLHKDATSVVIIPDSSPPVPGKVFDGGSVLADINFQTDLSTVRGSWESFQEPDTSIKQYYYAIGSCKIAENYHVTNDDFVAVNPPRSKSFTLNNAKLVNGQRYCIKVKAANLAGVQSIVKSSDGFIVDATPPDISNAEVTDGSDETDIDYQSDATSVSVRWEGIKDLESGIKYYKVALSRNQAGQPNIAQFVNIGLKSSATIRNLNLPHEVVYCIVCAVNFANLESCKSSDGVLIDPTPPKKGVVHDGILEPDIDFQSNNRTISANWEGIWDVESRVSKFEWSIGTSSSKKEDVMRYTYVGLATHVTSEVSLNLVSGKKYYIHLRVTNQAGGVTHLSSDGVVIDNTPAIPSVIEPEVVKESIWLRRISDRTFYSSKASHIAAYWEHFVEKESELWYYKWGIGTNRCGTQVHPFINIGRVNNSNTTNLNLEFREGVKYYVTVLARNRAGLVSRSCSDAMIIDKTPPSPGKVKTSGSKKSKLKYFKPNENIVVSWDGFLDKESNILNYRIDILATSTNQVVFSAKQGAQVRNITIQTRQLQNKGKHFRARVSCYNKANMWTVSLSETFVFDLSPPVPQKVTFGDNHDEHKLFQSNTESITAMWDPFKDEESPITHYEAAVVTSTRREYVVPFKNVGFRNKFTFTPLRLTHGLSYYVSIRATNAAGLSTITFSPKLTIDTTPPLATNESLLDGEKPLDIDYFANVSYISAHWEAVRDPESGIVSTTYCIGTIPYGCQTKLPEDIGSNNSFNYQTDELVSGTRYFVTLEVKNGAGLTSSIISDGITFDTTPPNVGKVFDGLALENGQDVDVAVTPWNVSVTWFGVEDFESGIQNCKWIIKSSLGTTLFSMTIAEEPFGNQKTIHLGRTTQELMITEGTMCFNVLMCTNMAGLESTSYSDGFKVVSQWPIPGVVRHGTQGLALKFQSDRSKISANWGTFISDDRDPVAYYEWSLGTVRGIDDVMNFTEVGKARQATTDISEDALLNSVIHDGVKYYVTVRATTAKGLRSSSSSNGFVLDTSPTKRVNVTVNHTVVDEKTGKVSLSASWIGVEDKESEIKSSQVCLGTVSGSCSTSPVNVVNVTVAFIDEFYPKQDTHYYFNVKVKNGAGLVTVMTSKEFSIDTTPPSPGNVIDGNEADQDFSNSTKTLSVNWTGFIDKETAVISCIWTVKEKTNGIRKERTMFEVPVDNSGNSRKDDLALTPGKQYVSKIRCYNKDGFSSVAQSDGITIDITPPDPSSVYDGLSKQKDIDFQASVDVIESTWDAFSDEDSGIIGYRWCVSLSPRSCDINEFRWVGLKTSVHATNITLIANKRYYTIVEAINGAGMTSQASSDGFIVDTSPPETTVELTNQSLRNTWLSPSEKLTASWWSLDNTSGIASAEYCIGTTPYGCQVKKFTTLELTMGEFGCPDCVLKHKVSYFVLVRVWNGAGLYSMAATQNARPDHTPPTSGTVKPNKTVISCTQGCVLLYQVNGFADEESGLQSCRFVIRNQTGFVTTFQNFQLSNKLEVTGVKLTHGSKYAVVVSCSNAIGLVSSQVTSKETLVDNTPPTKGHVIVSKDLTHDIMGIHEGCHLSNKSLRVHWNGFQEKESEIIGFKVGLGNFPLVADIRPMVEVGVVTNTTINLSDVIGLDPAQILYVTVEATNTAGLVSKATSPPTRLVNYQEELFLGKESFDCLSV